MNDECVSDEDHPRVGNASYWVLFTMFSWRRAARLRLRLTRHGSRAAFGNPETTPGGNALKFYASVRLDIRRIGHLKQGEENIGSRVRVKVVKNKCAPPFRQAEFEVLYGAGINLQGEIIDLGATHGLLEKSGAWYILDGERIAQGRDKACAFLVENPEIAEALRDRLMSAMKAVVEPRAIPVADDQVEAATEAAA